MTPDALLPQARLLAIDMLSVLPEMLLRYKKLIDDGYRSTFGDGMALELSTSKTANAAVSAEEIEARREAVRQRGQKQ